MIGDKKNILILQKEYVEMINDMKKIKVTLPTKEELNQYHNDSRFFNLNGKLLVLDNSIKSYIVAPKNDYLNNRKIFAYDESIVKYNCLEGIGYHTAHSLIYLGENDYIPCGFLSFYFYTASKMISNQASFIKLSDDIEMESKRDYMKDKIGFLLENVPQNSLVLIDGPLIAGDVYTYMIKAIEDFLERNIIPVFFVKNSSSNMVVDNVDHVKQRFNSDMHWSFEFLKKGERSSFFKYTDLNNECNSKVFCYIKPYNKSPQRIEFHPMIYNGFENEIDDIVSLIYYFLLANGENNVQTRPIAIAEKYAREFIKVLNIDEYFFNYGFVPTMNQERFG